MAAKKSQLRLGNTKVTDYDTKKILKHTNSKSLVHHAAELRKIIILNTRYLIAMLDSLCSNLHTGVPSHNHPMSSDSPSACNDYYRKKSIQNFLV